MSILVLTLKILSYLCKAWTWLDKSTRVHNNSYSLIDNIFKNSLEFRDLYDHVKSKRLTRDFSNYTETKLLRELSEIDLLGTICDKVDILYVSQSTKQAPK